MKGPYCEGDHVRLQQYPERLECKIGETMEMEERERGGDGDGDPSAESERQEGLRDQVGWRLMSGTHRLSLTGPQIYISCRFYADHWN